MMTGTRPVAFSWYASHTRAVVNEIRDEPWIDRRPIVFTELVYEHEHIPLLGHINSRLCGELFVGRVGEVGFRWVIYRREGF